MIYNSLIVRSPFKCQIVNHGYGAVTKKYGKHCRDLCVLKIVQVVQVQL